MNQNKKSRACLLVLVYIVGVVAALFLTTCISLPFSNPWSIKGPLTEKEYNPLNNVVKFVLLVAVPSMVLLLVSINRKARGILFANTGFLAPRGFSEVSESPSHNRKYLFFVSLVLCILVGINIPTYHSHGSFDSFHEGESLGASVSWTDGKTPYKEIIFVHGIFQDPLRAVVAYKLFGRSIGSVRTLESILKICAFLLLFIFALLLFEGNYLYAYCLLLLLILLSALKFVTIMPREVTTFSFLAVTASFSEILAARTNISKTKTCAKLFLFSFIPLISFCYSIDRGFYLLATYCILCPIILYCCYNKRFGLYSFVCSALGLLSGVAFMGVLLRWEFRAFFDFVFFTMPKYKELMDGYVYPLAKPLFILPILLVSLSSYWMTYRYMQAPDKSCAGSSGTWNYIKTHFMEICLLIMSVFYFRSALGRSDWDHVRYSSAIICILSTYIVVRHFAHQRVMSSDKCKRFVTYSIVLSISFIVGLSIFRTNSKGLLIENFPLKKSDSAFIPSHYAQTISFLKNTLADKESFFTMTSEGSWYYFVGKSCPTRFPVVWLAMPPFYQREIVRDLKRNNVKFILYRNHHPANRIDGFTSQERLPIIDTYLKANYRYFKTIDDNELWVKKKSAAYSDR